MKKILLVSALALTALTLTYCSGSKKATVSKTTYETGVATVIMDNCAPCHISSKGGRKKPYDNYANLKTDIDDILARVQMAPTDRGFMPFRATARISDSAIAVLKKWKSDGLLEK